MLVFSQIALLVLTMVAPIILLIIYAYVKSRGWRAVFYGILFSILVLVTVRFLLPMLFLNQSWFQALIANIPLYLTLYSLLYAGLCVLAIWLSFRYLFKDAGADRALVYGFSFGLAYEALFIGFNGVAALLSVNADHSGTDIGGIWFGIIEALAVLILFSGFALQIKKGMDEKKPLWMAAALCEIFLFFFLGMAWSTLFGWPRSLQEILLIAVCILMGYWISRSFSFKSLFAVEENAEAYDYEQKGMSKQEKKHRKRQSHS